MERKKIILLAVLVVVAVAILSLFILTESVEGEVPFYVTGKTREMYIWSKTPEGAALLEQIPCYCGCKYEGHKHTRHCFWRDDGTLDKHGITCSVCLDIAVKSKQMFEEGKSVCEIRKAIDEFYAPNAHLGTDTPMPEGCLAGI